MTSNAQVEAARKTKASRRESSLVVGELGSPETACDVHQMTKLHRDVVGKQNSHQ